MNQSCASLALFHLHSFKDKIGWLIFPFTAVCFKLKVNWLMLFLGCSYRLQPVYFFFIFMATFTQPQGSTVKLMFVIYDRNLKINILSAKIFSANTWFYSIKFFADN